MASWLDEIATGNDFIMSPRAFRQGLSVAASMLRMPDPDVLRLLAAAKHWYQNSECCCDECERHAATLAEFEKGASR